MNGVDPPDEHPDPPECPLESTASFDGVPYYHSSSNCCRTNSSCWESICKGKLPVPLACPWWMRHENSFLRKCVLLRRKTGISFWSQQKKTSEIQINFPRHLNLFCKKCFLSSSKTFPFILNLTLTLLKIIAYVHAISTDEAAHPCIIVSKLKDEQVYFNFLAN